MRHIHIEHETRYVYDHDVVLAQHLAHLRPLKNPWQTVLKHLLSISPPVDNRLDQVDAFGNTRTFFSLTTPHRELTVNSYSRVDKRARYANLIQHRHRPGTT